MTNLEELRMSILSQSDPLGSKHRFGLFSQPISTAIGDDGAFRNKIHPRNEMGKPVTQPRNVFVSPLKSGKGRSAYFGPLNSLADDKRKDIFMEEGVRLLKEQHQTFMNGRKQTNFYPIAGIKPITNSAYEYIEQKNPELEPKRFKMQDGRVRSGPKNFYTNPQSKVNQSVFRHYKYIEDPISRKHQQDLQKMRKSKAKEGEAAFVPNKFSSELFSKNKEIYGLDREITKSPSKQQNLNILQHEVPWSPASNLQKGLNGFFQPVHPYMQNPPPSKKRRPQVKTQKDPFLSMSISLTTPTPSVALNKVNMMSSINRSLVLRK